MLQLHVSNFQSPSGRKHLQQKQNVFFRFSPQENAFIEWIKAQWPLEVVRKNLNNDEQGFRTLLNLPIVLRKAKIFETNESSFLQMNEAARSEEDICILHPLLYFSRSLLFPYQLVCLFKFQPISSCYIFQSMHLAVEYSTKTCWFSVLYVLFLLMISCNFFGGLHAIWNI